MEGADLQMLGRTSHRRSAEWAARMKPRRASRPILRIFAAPVGLTQAQLDQMIGDAGTLLPETLDDGTVPSIPSCWATPPPLFEAMIDAHVATATRDCANKLRAEFLCPEGTDPARTGTPLALDAPYPEGHPLADRAD